MPSPSYIIIGGGAYQPGSAAAKKAQQLYSAMPQPSGGPIQSPIFTPPSGAAPANFPSYPATAGTMSSGGLPSGPTLAPGPATAGKGAFGLVPTVPNPISTAGGAITGNQANLPGLARLGTDTTQLNARLGALPYQSNLPNYMANLGQAATNVGQNLAGVISRPTSEAITRAAAERGASIGSPGSPNQLTNWLGVIGNTSEQLQALGAQQLNQMIASTPTGQPFNVAGQQISPADVQSAQYQANVLGAAPDPTQAAQANLDMLLRAIEAGRSAGNLGGIGGGGGGVPPMPRLTAPGGSLYPVSPSYGGDGGNGSGGNTGYTPRPATTAPGTSNLGGFSPFETDYLYKLFNEGSGAVMKPEATAGALADPFNLGGYQLPGNYDFNTPGPPADPSETDWNMFGVYDPMLDYGGG